MLAPAESSVSAVCQPDVRQHTGNASTHKEEHTQKKDLAHMRTRLFTTPNRTVAASERSSHALLSYTHSKGGSDICVNAHDEPHEERCIECLTLTTTTTYTALYMSPSCVAQRGGGGVCGVIFVCARLQSDDKRMKCKAAAVACTACSGELHICGYN